MLKGMKQVARAKAIYSYAAIKDDELSLKPGDIINVYKMELLDQGWWLGELNGTTGVFPENFVRLLPDQEGRQHQVNDMSQVAQEHGKAPTRPLPPQPKVGLIRSKVPAINKKVKDPIKQIVPNSSEVLEGFDFIHSSSKLSHITAGRVKGPTRRPPTRQNETPGIKTPASRHPSSGSSELDSCWGRGRVSESPGIYEEPPGKVLPPRGKFHESKKTFVPKNVHEENVKLPNQHQSKQNKGPSNVEPVAVETVPMEEYNAMVQELQSLQGDLREQTTTNERMVLTLRSLLQEERDKIATLALEFDKIKKSVLSMVSFL